MANASNANVAKKESGSKGGNLFSGLVIVACIGIGILIWKYVMGAPYFKKATITLENGKKLEISAPKNNDDNRYIRSLNYNGKNYTKNYLNHFDLLKGGRLVFDMDNKPNKGRGINESDFPYSFSRDAK